MPDIRTTLGGTEVVIHYGEAVHPPTELLGLDVESTYMTDRGQFDPDFHVRTVQFATKTEAWVFDLSNRAERTMAEVCLMDDRVSFCSHSNMDVLAVWAEFGIDISERNIDTLSLAQMAKTDKHADRDLKTLAAEYGMPELAQVERTLHTGFLELWLQDGGKKNAKKADVQAHGWREVSTDAHEFIEYAALDAIACRRLVELLIPATKAPAELLEKEQWLDVRTNQQQIRGMRVDTDRLDALLTEAREATSSAKELAEEITGGVNIGGPKVKDWFARHGVDWSTWPGARTEKGAPSLAKDNLALLGGYPLDHDARVVLDQMQAYAAHLDLLRKTEDIAKRLVWETHAKIACPAKVARIHPNVHPHGATTTGRMSSSGPNVQNFSKKDARHRGLFLPEPGHTLISIDFEQIELRVIAALAREEKMIETIRAGGDLHQLTVDELASVGVTITRQQAKIVNFLIVYGGGAAALHAQTGIPLDEAAAIIRAWRERYPAVTVFARYLAEYHREGIRTISNRWLPVTYTKDGDARTYASVNYATQSAARECLVDAWWKFEHVYGHRDMVWLPIHDELILHVPHGREHDVMMDAEQAMRRDFRNVPLTATAVVLLDEEGVSRWMPGDLTSWKPGDPVPN